MPVSLWRLPVLPLFILALPVNYYTLLSGLPGGLLPHMLEASPPRQVLSIITRSWAAGTLQWGRWLTLHILFLPSDC